MTFDAFMAMILESGLAQWHRVDADWHTYLNRFSQVEGYEDGRKQIWVEHTSHHSRFVYKPDLGIGLAWGMGRGGNESFHEDWLVRFSDENATAAWLDPVYHGQPIDRRLYVVVDGGRCTLPVPEQIFAKGIDWPREKRLWIRREDYVLFALVNELGGGQDYDRYLAQAGFDVPDD